MNGQASGDCKEVTEKKEKMGSLRRPTMSICLCLFGCRSCLNVDTWSEV